MKLVKPGQEKMPRIAVHQPKNGVGLPAQCLCEVASHFAPLRPRFCDGDFPPNGTKAETALHLADQAWLGGRCDTRALIGPTADLTAWGLAVIDHQRRIQNRTGKAVARDAIPKWLKCERVAPSRVADAPQPRRLRIPLEREILTMFSRFAAKRERRPGGSAEVRTRGLRLEKAPALQHRFERWQNIDVLSRERQTHGIYAEEKDPSVLLCIYPPRSVQARVDVHVCLNLPLGSSSATTGPDCCMDHDSGRLLARGA